MLIMLFFACQLVFGPLNAELVTGARGDRLRNGMEPSGSSEPTKNSVAKLANITSESDSDSDFDSEFTKYQGAFLQKDLVQLLFEQLDSQALSPECFNALTDYRTALQNGTSWAFKRK